MSGVSSSSYSFSPSSLSGYNNFFFTLLVYDLDPLHISKMTMMKMKRNKIFIM